MDPERLYKTFTKASNDIKNLSFTPDNDTLLQLYSLFKQSTIGDNTTESPSFFDFKNSAKWNAWNKLKGMSKEQAQIKYVKLVRGLLEK